MAVVRDLLFGVARRSWSRRRYVFIWVTAIITWATLHFIHGTRHNADSVPPLDKADFFSGSRHNSSATSISSSEESLKHSEENQGTLPWKVQRVSISEEENLLSVLKAAEKGSEVYQSSESLRKFWDSVDHAGSETEDDGTAASSSDKETVTAEIRSLQKKWKAKEAKKAQRKRLVESKRRNQMQQENSLLPGIEAAERWTAPKSCANVEEMGKEVSPYSWRKTLAIRKLISEHMKQHGATLLRQLSDEQFCQRGFVIAKGQHDGLGNNLYKVFTGAALALILNRSIVLAETGSKAIPSTHPNYTSQTRHLNFPFGDYIDYSSEMISIQALKQMWVTRGCHSRHGRPLVMLHYNFEKLAKQPLLCHDWQALTEPLIWLSHTSDAVPIQWLLKNRHIRLRRRASTLMGHPWEPASRPNLFGELARVLMAPNRLIRMAVNWTLRGESAPDIGLHLRQIMFKDNWSFAVSKCVERAIARMKASNSSSSPAGLPRLVIIADAPEAVYNLTKKLAGLVSIIQFDYKRFIEEHPGIDVMAANYFAVPEGRKADWGPLPRWVAIVEFFLASMSKSALLSGAGSRVATTFSQLAAALAASNQLLDDGSRPNFKFYSNFQQAIVTGGLSIQVGRGYAWNTFGGSLSCHSQPHQCALTPLMPFAWFDAPWQSPMERAIRSMQKLGLNMTGNGRVSQVMVENFCSSKQGQPDENVTLVLPLCQDVASCESR